MKLYNTLTRSKEEFKPLSDTVRIYSCGPTVYDHIHIGNLRAFITADLLRRTLIASGYKTHHVMNFTDVDDKTIRRSQEEYPDLNPNDALSELTTKYSTVFLADMREIGSDITALDFVKATESIPAMQELITTLHADGFAYIADDGVYFSIDAYRSSGRKYGQLTSITAENTGSARIDNDEYDKEAIHDFALWKKQKENEPSWDFELDGVDVSGRPGWHIECSAMSAGALGQPFDIHTGGVDLIFPHHENEIAQSTAGSEAVYANYFVHNEHLLVDGRKMSKSLSNFYTLDDIKAKGIDPLAFRLLVLQSHYRSQSNFTWEALEGAQNRLRDFYRFADLAWQIQHGEASYDTDFKAEAVIDAIADDLNTPQALASLGDYISTAVDKLVFKSNESTYRDALGVLENVLGLDMSHREDISDAEKKLIAQREIARKEGDWDQADDIRNQLENSGIELRDVECEGESRCIWSWS